MASVNKVILIGNLGRDPEVVTCQMATQCQPEHRHHRKVEGQGGEQQEQTEWHELPSSGARRRSAANICARAVRCKSKGALQRRKWTGGREQRYTTEIRGDRMGARRTRGGGGTEPCT
jgi:single-strand DNA-binding protein